jgi:hypothetical protein
MGSVTHYMTDQCAILVSEGGQIRFSKSSKISQKGALTTRDVYCKLSNHRPSLMRTKENG